MLMLIHSPLQHALYLVYLGLVVLVSAWMGTSYNLDLISFVLEKSFLHTKFFARINDVQVSG